MKNFFSITLYILLFLLLSMISGIGIYQHTQQKQARYFFKEAEVLQVAYHAILNTYAQTARTVSDEISQQADIMEMLQEAMTADEARQNTLRNTLFVKLYPTYNRLQKQNIPLFHFQFPNGISFLKMHNPEKYGEPLFKERPSIKLTNSLQIATRGFEIGSDDVGFRYVFPLFFNLIHVGSLEIGVSLNGIREHLEALFLRENVFLLKKEMLGAQSVSSDYTPSLISADYVRDDLNICVHEGEDTLRSLDQQISERAAQHLAVGKSFVIPAHIQKNDFLVIFIPIEDVERNHVGYVVKYARDSVVRQYTRTFYLQLGGSTVIVLLLVSAVYAINRSRDLIAHSRDQLQRITDSMMEGLFVLDRKQQITFVNPAAEKIMKCSQTELIGKNVHDFIHDQLSQSELKDSPERRVYQAIHAGLTYASDEHHFLIGDHTLVSMEVSCAPIYEHGRFLGTVLVFRDITSRKQAEEQLQLMNQQLQEASQHKSSFLASMSHELRTPLNAMIGYTSLTLRALKDTLPPRHLKNLIKAEHSSRLLLQLINDILDFSKIEAGKMETCIESTVLTEVFEDVIVTAEGLLLDKPVALQKSFPETLPVIYSDYTKLKQILNNLLSNAIKFTSEGQVILRAEYRQNEQIIRIEVEDTGCGIPQDKLGSIFESFKQVDGSIKKKFGGTGLGLAISKKLCLMLGIEIGVESELDKGALFWLNVPIHIKEKSCESPQSLALPEVLMESEQTLPMGTDHANLPGFEQVVEAQIQLAHGSGLRSLLIIDDNTINLQMFEEIFENEGISVYTAQSGQAGIELAQKYVPDSILMDLAMPDLDGFETTMILKQLEHTRHIPIIACSALATKETRERAFQVGCKGYITKPVEPDRLVAQVTKLIALAKTEGEKNGKNLGY
ncbi:two-component sensor/response regulator hybrid [Candidatus Vecturithrix granuli]|uniref:histidine kinase n=1 Tax=Vecturithrix granuli TaxID=1499967 RepID=A0A0S6W6X2_VECG1|nr:two-component sensor/response regulator hybrid [Candidatus Vecturithrix granuli]